MNEQTSFNALRETPGERVLYAGARVLSNQELIATLLGDMGLAALVMDRFPTIRDLVNALPQELQQVRGISTRRAATLKAALELGRRSMMVPADERRQVRTPADAANVFMAMIGLSEQELLCTMLLDTRNRVTATPTIYMGSVNTTMVRIAEVIRPAVRLNAPAMIVAHNHPTGDPSPSPEDVALTRELIEAAKMLDIEVLDHLVIGQGRYVSMKERGLAFE